LSRHTHPTCEHVGSQLGPSGALKQRGERRRARRDSTHIGESGAQADDNTSSDEHAKSIGSRHDGSASDLNKNGSQAPLGVGSANETHHEDGTANDGELAPKFIARPRDKGSDDNAREVLGCASNAEEAARRRAEVGVPRRHCLQTIEEGSICANGWIHSVSSVCPYAVDDSAVGSENPSRPREARRSPRQWSRKTLP